MTITLDKAGCDGLRPHVLGKSLDDGYKAMSEDPDREAEAIEWVAGMGSAANRDDGEMLNGRP